jgi:hypothetical protein
LIKKKVVRAADGVTPNERYTTPSRADSSNKLSALIARRKSRSSFSSNVPKLDLLNLRTKIEAKPILNMPPIPHKAPSSQLSETNDNKEIKESEKITQNLNKYRQEYETYKSKYKDDSSSKYTGVKVSTPSRNVNDSDYNKYKTAADNSYKSRQETILPLNDY